MWPFLGSLIVARHRTWIFSKVSGLLIFQLACWWASVSAATVRKVCILQSTIYVDHCWLVWPRKAIFLTGCLMWHNGCARWCVVLPASAYSVLKQFSPWLVDSSVAIFLTMSVKTCVLLCLVALTQAQKAEHRSGDAQDSGRLLFTNYTSG